jgi:hypothetical protein
LDRLIGGAISSFSIKAAMPGLAPCQPIAVFAAQQSSFAYRVPKINRVIVVRGAVPAEYQRMI